MLSLAYCTTLLAELLQYNLQLPAIREFVIMALAESHCCLLRSAAVLPPNSTRRCNAKPCRNLSDEHAMALHQQHTLSLPNYLSKVQRLPKRRVRCAYASNAAVKSAAQ
jgi:hypothetical protein